jgi:integrase
MSVHPERGPGGAIVYRVRWREGGRGSPARCRTFDHEDDAREFDRRVRRLKQTGDPALFADEVTLGEYVHGEWWPNYAERRLALSTQESHSIDLDLRILPRLGDLPLARVWPSVVERFAADLERAGVGRATIVSTLAVLQGVMKRAVRDYNLPGNPVKAIDKPSQRCEREPVLVTVAQVEAMRVWCLEREDLRSATLISLLAYAGPRPESEALPMPWAAVRRRTILFRATKRGVPYERATRLLEPLAQDLELWRAQRGSPAESSPVIPNGRGEVWTEHDWDNWRTRTFRAAAKAAGLRAGKDDGPRRVRPRDLRSSFATLLIYEGQPPQYVADQLGNSPGTLLRDYARVWEDFDPSQRVSAETQIDRARARSGRAAPKRTSAPEQRLRRARKRQRVSEVFHGASDEAAGDHERPGNPGSPLPDSNRRPLPYHGSALPTELRGRRPAECRPG